MYGAGNTAACLRPRRVPEPGKLGPAPRPRRLGLHRLRHRQPPRLPRRISVTLFFYAYSVLAKPKYAFIPDVRLVLAKLGLHLVLDGSDCIDFGIDNLHDCLDASPSLSSHTISPAATSTPAPDHDTDHGDPSRGSLDQGCSTPALGYLDIGTKGYHLA